MAGGERVENSPETLAVQAEQDALAPERPLVVEWTALDKQKQTTCKHAFSDLAARYPEHKALVNRLLVGAPPQKSTLVRFSEHSLLCLWIRDVLHCNAKAIRCRRSEKWCAGAKDIAQIMRAHAQFPDAECRLVLRSSD